MQSRYSTPEVQNTLPSNSQKPTPTPSLKPPDEAPKKEFSCPFCSSRFNSLREAVVHKSTHFKKVYQCGVCRKQFLHERKLHWHVRIHSQEVRCKVCFKKYKTPRTLQSHMILHSGEKKHTCTICDKKFNQLSNLKYHVNLHTKEKVYKCDKCGKESTSKSNLKSHLKVHDKKTLPS